MQRLFEEIKDSGVFDGFVSAASRGEDLVIAGLWDSVKALLSTLLADQGQRTVLYVTRSPTEAEILCDDITSFSKGSALLFPSWETLPHEKIAPHPEIVSDRFKVLRRLLDKSSSRKPVAVIASPQAFLRFSFCPCRS